MLKKSPKSGRAGTNAAAFHFMYISVSVRFLGILAAYVLNNIFALLNLSCVDVDK